MDENMGSVDAVLMASGFSKRFGKENKLLAPFCGKPLAYYPLKLACDCGLFQHIFFVCNNAEVESLANHFPVTVLHNANAQNGAGESVRLGVQASDAEYYLFLPCDQPLLDFETLQKIVKMRKPNRIVQPCFENRVGSPVLFSSFFQKELCSLMPNEAARKVIQRHPQEVLRLPLETEAPLLDVDTPQDLLALSQILGQYN